MRNLMKIVSSVAGLQDLPNEHIDTQNASAEVKIWNDILRGEDDLSRIQV